MTRYIPTPKEEAAIDLLTLAGYHVMRERSYAALVERVRMAEAMREMETERRQSAERWAHRCLDEERRLTHRLNEVCYAATAAGVSIQAINAALQSEETP